MTRLESYGVGATVRLLVRVLACSGPHAGAFGGYFIISGRNPACGAAVQWTSRAAYKPGAPPIAIRGVIGGFRTGPIAGGPPELVCRLNNVRLTGGIVSMAAMPELA